MQHTVESQKLNILQSPVAEFVPHSPPMVLLDRIVDFSANSLQAEVTVTANSRFYDAEQQGIETWVGIEYMAQAIAALAGVRAKLRGESVKLGFLLGTRKMRLHQAVMPASQSYLIDIAELYMDDSGLGAFSCSIKNGDTLISEAKLNVFETNDKSQLSDY